MEFFLYLLLFWIICGIASWLYMLITENTSEGLGTDAFIGALLLGPIIWVMVIKDNKDHKKWEKEYQAREIKRKEKAAATKKKKKQEALKNLPIELDKAEKNITSIKNGDLKISEEFFDDIEKICNFCSSLTKANVTNKDLLIEILIYAKESIIEFYAPKDEIKEINENPKIARASGTVGKDTKQKPAKSKQSKADKLTNKINRMIKKFG